MVSKHANTNGLEPERGEGGNIDTRNTKKIQKNIDTRNTKWQKWDKYERKIKIKIMFWEGKQLKRSTETSTERIKVKKGNN